MQWRKSNKPYTLQRRNIHPQYRLPVPELISEQIVSLGWPLEFQGTGITNYRSGELEIYYPRGDLFLSFVFVIHELGHWRQGEIDSNLERRVMFTPNENITDIVTNELEAYQRGWLRTQIYTPELIAMLDSKLAVYQKQSELEDFSNFEQLYLRVQELGLTVSRVIATVEHTDDESEYDRQKYEALKATNIQEVFQNFRTLRVGELINTHEVECFLLKVARNVADE